MKIDAKESEIQEHCSKYVETEIIKRIIAKLTLEVGGMKEVICGGTEDTHAINAIACPG